MSQSTPPGWYADPGRSTDEPPRERWWDGAAWTATTRPAENAPTRTPTVPSLPLDPAGGPHTLPTLPGDRPLAEPEAPPEPPPAPEAEAEAVDQAEARGRRRDRAVIGFGLLGLALTGALVAALLLGDDGRSGSPPAEGTGPPPSAGESPDDGQPPPDAGPLSEGRVAGVALPVPEQWSERPGESLVSLAYGAYPCPADAALDCLAGAATLHALPGAGTLSVEGAARSDVVAFQRDAYPAEAYGGVFGADELSAGSVTVAGEPGFRVRVGLTTPFSSAVVESVAFVAPGDPSTLLVLRLSWDDVGQAPPMSDLELILDGTAAVSDGPGTAA
ncbi:Protein of unknown function [Streptomyces zhaozhouensis]|uniref:DUF2510 domain-containing protein n=1 Tax=Streptomyces zhaozhouensis TaxID=1300267 RepID=A0A286DRZ9_9ACTN|nr:DUF2510 domain-containing protein [Streptomyces zhaozhouensis]SOD61457.1 Protein of unknown function [Streptomyces zhaozhouensis]